MILIFFFFSKALCKVNISAGSVTRLPLLSCTSWWIWKQAQIEISPLHPSADLSLLLEPKQIILIQAQIKTFQWLLWESKTASKIVWTKQQVLFPVRKVSVKLFLIHLEEIWNNSLRNAMRGKPLLGLGFSLFPDSGGFLHAVACMCNSAKCCNAARAAFFSGSFLFGSVCCWVYLLAAVLSKCHWACLALIKLTLPKAGFQLDWWANPAGQLGRSENMSPSWGWVMQVPPGFKWQQGSSSAFEFRLFSCHRSQQDLSHFPIPRAVQKNTSHSLMFSFKCFSF